MDDGDKEKRLVGVSERRSIWVNQAYLLSDSVYGGRLDSGGPFVILT